MQAHRGANIVIHVILIAGLSIPNVASSLGREVYAAHPSDTRPADPVRQEVTALDVPFAPSPFKAEADAKSPLTDTMTASLASRLSPIAAELPPLPDPVVQKSGAEPELPGGGAETPVTPPQMPDYDKLPEQTIITDTEIVPLQPVWANLAFSAHGVVAGQVVTARLVLSTTPVVSDLVVIAQLPAGLDYVANSAKAADYDPATRTLRWTNPSTDASKAGTVDLIQFVVNTDPAKGPATLVVPLRIEAKGLASPITTEPTLPVGVARAAKPQSKGDGATKELKANPRVTLEFPADEALANQDVTVVEYPAEPITKTKQRGLLMQFGPAATFKQPVTLTVNLDGVFSTGLLDAGYEPVLIYWPDMPEKIEIIGPDGKPQTVEAIRSRRVPSTFDASSKTLVAQLPHFSTYV
jgi:hypothetical protein